MKFLDRLILKLFALIVGVETIMVVLATTGIIPMEYLTEPFTYLTCSTEVLKGTLIVSAVLLILVLKALCFSSKPDNDGKDGVVLENNNGKLVISKETLDNIISGIAKDIAGTESTSSKTIVDKNRNLRVYVTTLVNKDVMIKDVSSELQDKIIDAMKKTADLDVKEVNVRVKNITSKKLKGLPSKKIAELPEETVTETEEPKIVAEEENNNNTQEEEV